MFFRVLLVLFSLFRPGVARAPKRLLSPIILLLSKIISLYSHYLKNILVYIIIIGLRRN